MDAERERKIRAGVDSCHTFHLDDVALLLAALDEVRAKNEALRDEEGMRVDKYVLLLIERGRRCKEHLGQLRRVKDQRDEARTHARESQDAVASLREAGRPLATCAFNLKQMDHLSERERRSLRLSQEGWDAALVSLDSAGGG